MSAVIVRDAGRLIAGIRNTLSDIRAKLRLRNRIKHAWGFSQASLTFFFVVVIWDILTSIWDTGTISHPPVSAQSALTIVTFVGLVAGLFFIVSRSSERLWRRSQKLSGLITYSNGPETLRSLLAGNLMLEDRKHGP